MRYVLDSNILVTANRLDFPMAASMEFWNWLVQLGKIGKIIIPEAVYEEIGKGHDELPTWLDTHKFFFRKPIQDAAPFLPTVLHTYSSPSGAPMTEIQLERLGADPYVIAHAMAVKGVVVSEEAPKRATAPHNKKIPDICSALKVPCVRFPRFIWEMK